VNKLLALVLLLCGLAMTVLATATMFGIAWQTAAICMLCNVAGYLLVALGVGILKG
jgi:hypothetical protein